MKTISIRYAKHPPIIVPIKAQFKFIGFQWAIHRPVFYYMSSEHPTISKKHWSCSEIKSGASIPLANELGELPATIKETKCRAMERLSNRIDRIGIDEVKKIIIDAQNKAN